MSLCSVTKFRLGCRVFYGPPAPSCAHAYAATTEHFLFCAATTEFGSSIAPVRAGVSYFVV